MQHVLPKDFEMEIQIVDHCNLRCDNCNHFANLATEPWYMSKEEFEYSVLQVHDNFASHGLVRFMILGGEPFLHPQIKEFVAFACKVFSGTPVQVDVLTNGIVLQKYSKEELKFFRDRGARLTVTPYPNVKYSQNFIDNVKNGDIGLLHSRLFFAQNPIRDIPIHTARHEYENCSKYKIPCLCIRNYKIYSCPFGATIHLYNKKFNKNIQTVEGDYLDIHTATFEQLKEFVSNGPVNICKYCDYNCMPVYWSSKGYSAADDYDATNDLDLYFTDYEKYDNLYNGKNIFEYFQKQSMFNDESEYNFLSLIDEDYALTMTKNELSRLRGKIDIIIPYYNITKELVTIMYDYLSKQTMIQDCHIYFISDNSPKEDIVFNTFHNIHHLNVTFLRTEKRIGPGGARELGLSRSYNPYVFFMDADDMIINPNMFQDMYDLIQGKDLVSGKTIKIDCMAENNFTISENFIWDNENFFSQDIHCILYSRDFLIKNNIHYKPVFIAEDADWISQVRDRNPLVATYDKESYVYMCSMSGGIGNESTVYDKLFYRIISVIDKPPYRDVNECWLTLLDCDQLEQKYNDFSDDMIENIVAISFFFAKKFYLKYKKEISLHPKENQYSYMLYNHIIDNQSELLVNGKVFKTNEDYISLILDVINKSKFADNILEYLGGYLID